MELDKHISKNDILVMLEIANASLLCHSVKDYGKLIKKFNSLLFFDYAISGLMDMRHISYDNLISTSINNGYPDAYLETYTNNKYYFLDPLFQYFYKTLDIQNSEEVKHLYKVGPGDNIVRLREDFGIHNVFLYGIYDSYYNYLTGISIAGKQIKNERRTRAIIKTLVPHLSISIKHLVPISQKEDVIALTPMELEVLKWLKEGKSSWEVSMILKRSERAVNFHINNILKKLHAMNRTHAVAIALEKTLIPI